MSNSEFVGMAAPVVSRVTLPIVGRKEEFEVRRIYCVGRNYIEHILEMQEGEVHDPPFFFQKPTDAIVANGQVPYPSHTEDFQFEAELVVGIGHSAKNIPVDRALDVVYGYAAGIDLTRRDRQRESFAKGLPWEVGKSFDFSAPCGAIHPVADWGHKTSGTIELSVNGVTRQKSILEKMIWNVPHIISQLSAQYELHPGDLIFTGTPEGVGPIVSGDRLKLSVVDLQPLEITILPSI